MSSGRRRASFDCRLFECQRTERGVRLSTKRSQNIPLSGTGTIASQCYWFRVCAGVTRERIVLTLLLSRCLSVPSAEFPHAFLPNACLLFASLPFTVLTLFSFLAVTLEFIHDASVA